jgi:hypothetical protein
MRGQLEARQAAAAAALAHLCRSGDVADAIKLPGSGVRPT